MEIQKNGVGHTQVQCHVAWLIKWASDTQTGREREMVKQLYKQQELVTNFYLYRFIFIDLSL